MFKLYNSFGELSTISLAFWTNFWFRNWWFLAKFFPDVEVYQTTLDHRNQIALIVGHDEAIRAVPPASVPDKLVIDLAMLFESRVKRYQWTTIEFQPTHLDRTQALIIASRASN